MNPLIDRLLNTVYCGDFFEENDEIRIREKYRETAKIIHPDVCNEPGAKEAFSKLCNLYQRALQCIRSGTWDETDTLRLPGMKPIHFLDHLEFELGVRYVTNDEVIYVFEKGKEKYQRAYLDNVQQIRYRDHRMESTYRKRMPAINFTKDRAVFIRKDPKEYPMDLFLLTYGDQLTGRDIAWMISRMCDLLCFLQNNELVLNGMKPENLFIQPETHSISIYGGWWYSTKWGRKMTGVSKDIYDLLPFSVRKEKKSDYLSDIESMRMMFQKICKGKDLPAPFQKWLNAGSLSNPIEEYSRWHDALDKSYGKRKFIVFTEDANKIYKTGEEMKGEV